jgi:hypothetical protein
MFKSTDADGFIHRERVPVDAKMFALWNRKLVSIGDELGAATQLEELIVRRGVCVCRRRFV